MTKCNACFKELGKKDVVYTEDKQPYCVNPFVCNEFHPNSVNNIIARGGAVRMFTEEELETNIFDKYNVSDEMKERVMKVANKPQSIRLSKYDIAYYLLQLQATRELSSISEAVRYCVGLAMEQEPIVEPVDSVPVDESSDNEPTFDLRDPITNPEPLPDVIEKSKGVKIIPKGKDLIMAQIAEKQTDDDDMTF